MARFCRFLRLTPLLCALVLMSLGDAARSQTASPPTPSLPPLPRLVAPSLPPGAKSPAPIGEALRLKQAIALALYHQPQISIAGAAAEASAGRTRQAASALYPSLSVSSQYTRTGAGR